jgi:hypothetical protein
VKDLDPVLPEPKLKYTPAVCVFGRLRDVSELELEAVPVGLGAQHSAASPGHMGAPCRAYGANVVDPRSLRPAPYASPQRFRWESSAA